MVNPYAVDADGSRREGSNNSNNVTLAPALGTASPAEIFSAQQVIQEEDDQYNVFTQHSHVKFASPHTPPPFASGSGSGSQPPTAHGTSQRPRRLSDFPPSRHTGYIYDERMMLHAPLNYRVEEDGTFLDDGYDEFDPDGEFRRSHPEEPRRIAKIFERLKKASLIGRMLKLPCVEVEKHEAMLIHTERLWDSVQSTYCKFFFIIIMVVV